MATYNVDGTTDYVPGESNDRASADGVAAAAAKKDNNHTKAPEHTAAPKHKA